jgi:hypothetical protein
LPLNREELLDKLRQSGEVNITVTGRRSKRKRSTPVWFVLDGTTVKLVPMKGAETPWFRNLAKDPEIGLGVTGTLVTAKAILNQDPKEAERILDRFRTKYKSMWSESYYPNRDVYVEVHI